MISALLDGNRRFVAETFEKERDFFLSLSKGQRAAKEKKLNVHGWVYDMSTGEIKPVKNA